MTIRPVHHQRNAYKLTVEEAGALLWYRSLPYLARRCLCSLVLRLVAGMSAEEAGTLYHLKPGRIGRRFCALSRPERAGHEAAWFYPRPASSMGLAPNRRAMVLYTVSPPIGIRPVKAAYPDR